MKIREPRAAMRYSAGLAGDPVASPVQFAPGAQVAQQFRDGRPGRYSIDVKVEGVPLAADKSPYFDLATWNSSVAQAGYPNVTVTDVRFVLTQDTNPRSTGGPLDVFGWGEAVADYTYRLTVDVAPVGGGDSGVGALPVAAAVVGAVVAVSLIVYWVTGKNVLVVAVRWLGEAVAAAAEVVATSAVPILLVVGVALFAFAKMGGKGSYKGFSIGT